MPKLYRDCCLIVRNNRPVVVICILGSIIIGFYFFNFNDRLSPQNGDWGTFGDYVGGILNPVIAAFAFYLIRETYKLQKKELSELTEAQEKQIKLAALTALLNSNLTRIGVLESEKASLLNGNVPEPKNSGSQSHENSPEFSNGLRKALEPNSTGARKVYRIQDIDKEITDLTKKNNGLMKQIEDFLK